MSCNNYLTYYSRSCYGCDPCRTKCIYRCQYKCYDPCSFYCKPYQSICNICPDTCQTICNICPPQDPAVSLIISAPTPITIPAGGVPITLPAVFTGTIPAGTVTVIANFILPPTTNIGGITVNATTGFFTVPLAGRYVLTGSICFSAVTTTSQVTLYVYRIDSLNNITLLGANTVTASSSTTCNTVTTQGDLLPGDRIFFAVTSSLTSISITDNRFALTRIPSPSC